MNIQTISLDVTKKPNTLPVVRIRQGDKLGTTVKALIFDDGEPLDLSLYTAKFCMRVPRDYGYYEVSGSVEGNVAEFLLDETYAAGESGRSETAYVQLNYSDRVVYSTNDVNVVVLPSATEGEQAGTYTNGVERWLAEAQEDVDGMQQQVDDVTDRAEAAIEAMGDISELAVPLMSADVRGGAKLGDGLQIDGESLGLSGESYTSAEKSKLAGIEANANDYELPVATTGMLGGVKPDGTTITVDNDGTIHGASTYTLPPATTTTLGGVKPDGATIDVTSDGTISAKQSELYTPDGTTAIVEVDANGDVDVSGGVNMLEGMQIASESAYPLYIRSSVPASTGTMPTLPCFVYCTADNGLYYCEDDS